MCNYLSKKLGNSGLPKAAASPKLTNVSGKGIAGKSGGSLGAGDVKGPGTLKGFSKGGQVKP